MAASREPTTSLQNWKFPSSHVQQNLTGGDFIGSHSTILCATVPRMADLGQAAASALAAAGAEDLGTAVAIPIGIIDSASLQQDRQIQQIFEIGSKRSYIVAARTMGMLNIQRVLYKGPNLLRMLYSYYPANKLGTDTGNTLRDIIHSGTTSGSTQSIGTSSQGGSGTDIAIPSYQDAASLPDMSPENLAGYDNMFFNLDSNIFSQPYGIIMYMKDNNENEVASVFLEECYIQNHVMGISANSVILAEQVTMRFERVVPIKVKFGLRTPTTTNTTQTATATTTGQ